MHRLQFQEGADAIRDIEEASPHSLKNGGRVMRKRRWLGLLYGNLLMAAALMAWPDPVSAQSQAAGNFKCNMLHAEQTVAGSTDLTSSDPNKLTPVNASTKDMILKSGLPCDGVNTDKGPAALPIANRQRGFDFYSWLTFIALNSPADNPTGIATSRSDSKAAWEDGKMFKPLLDVMLPNNEVPTWEKTVIPPACQDLYAERKRQHQDRMVVKMIEESFNEPFKTGALIDQHNNYAIFDILMNRQMFDYIVEHGLHSRALQESDRNANLRVDFPAGHHDKTTGLGDPGAIMLKVSWKILTKQDDKDKFHHVEALVAMPENPDEKGTPPCIERTLGLVGMHIVHKTATRPQWIWTSFEHADNVPELKDVQARKFKKYYNFFNPACEAQKCPINATPPRPWDPEYAAHLQFHKAADGKEFHSQIVRMVNLTDETNTMNRQFQSILSDTVWKNYIMIGTQWPSSFPCTGDHSTISGVPDPKTDFDKQPDMNCAPAPTFLANSTLETFSQGKIPQASSSCMACHGNATSYLRRSANGTAEQQEKFMNQSDFTFMLEKAR
jgi:hypothetical protein